MQIINSINDKELHEIMTNLAGHDIEELEEVFSKNRKSSNPTCFICYTVKGFGLPLAGHKDNHSGIMNMDQFKNYQNSMKIRKGMEWDKTEGMKISKKSLKRIFQKMFFIKIMVIALFVIVIFKLRN